MRRGGLRHRVTACLCLLVLASGAAAVSGDDSSPCADSANDIWTPAACEQDLACDVGCDLACDADESFWPRFAYYVKAGPTVPLGDGFFGNDVGVGYQIAGGVREPLLPGYESTFWDFGGSYLSAFGTDRTITVSGNVDDLPLTAPTVPAAVRSQFMDLTLTEISRAGAHAAIGWFLQQDYQQESTGLVRSIVSARIGGRLSHIHGHFREQPTAGLLQYLNTNKLTDVQLVKSHGVGNDTACGLFGGCEMSLSHPLANAGVISLLVDAEIANDWINLEGYHKAGLPTASVLFGLAVSR